MQSGAWALLGVLAASLAGATSYVMTTDDELLARADLIVVATIENIDAAPVFQAEPATDHLIQIERVLKGFVGGGSVLVRLPGGVREDGTALHVFGMPSFRVGQRVLLFLARSDSGAYRLVEYGLGSFQEIDSPNRPALAMRDLGGAHTLVLPGDRQAELRSRSHLPRDFERFAQWLEERARGRSREPDYFVAAEPEEIVALSEPFTIIRPPAGACGNPSRLAVRWIQFDANQRVPFLAHSGGQTGVPGGGFSQVRSALGAWNNDPQSTVLLRYGGTTSITRAGALDGVNVVLFEDPSNEIDGSFTGVGVVAIATGSIECRVTSYSGGKAFPLVDIGIVTQDGSGSLFFAAVGNALLTFAEVIAHEFGHAIGLGHSCGDSSSPSCSGTRDAALMRAQVHGDNRGAKLSGDDKLGVRFLYGVAQSPQVNAPSNLTAVASSTSEIALAWTDNSSNETGLELEEYSFAAGWNSLQTLPADTTAATITGIAEASYRRYRVRAVTADETSDYSNEAGATTLATVAPCVEDANTLCLNLGRFQITLRFRTPQIPDGIGQLERLSDDTGYVWFFNSENVEMVIKQLDGCSINDHFWTFAGGLTNVELELTVVDTQTGLANTYINPAGTALQPIQDTGAFATCP